MSCQLRRFQASVIAAVVVLGSFATRAVADEWQDRHAVRCAPVFSDYRGVELGQLQQCLAAWYQTRDMGDVKQEEQSRVAEAASRLYQEGNREQEHLGRTVMMRAGLTPPPKVAKAAVAKPEVEETAELDAPKKPKRAKYEPGETSEKDQGRAKKLRDEGFKEYKKEKYDKALGKFEKAIEIYPGYVQALYDAACACAVMGRGKDAVEYLHKLTDVGSKDALSRVFKARVDRDFIALRDDPAFREATGYVRVKITNGVGEYGEDEVERIKAELSNLRHDVAAVTPDKTERKRPIIWHKDSREAKSAAYIFDKVLNHPETKFNVIDWETEFDIIISWGDDIQKDDHGDPIVKSYAPSSPADAEKKTDQLMYEQDAALRKPEEHARKVQHTVETPDRMERKAEASGRRVESTIKTMEKTGDKIKGLFK
jgi:tetratricopeptide (TPR) repeat protein